MKDKFKDILKKYSDMQKVFHLNENDVDKLTLLYELGSIDKDVLI